MQRLMEIMQLWLQGSARGCIMLWRSKVQHDKEALERLRGQKASLTMLQRVLRRWQRGSEQACITLWKANAARTGFVPVRLVVQERTKGRYLTLQDQLEDRKRTSYGIAIAEVPKGLEDTFEHTSKAKSLRKEKSLTDNLSPHRGSPQGRQSPPRSRKIVQQAHKSPAGAALRLLRATPTSLTVTWPACASQSPHTVLLAGPKYRGVGSFKTMAVLNPQDTGQDGELSYTVTHLHPNCQYVIRVDSNKRSGVHIGEFRTTEFHTGHHAGTAQ